MKKRNIVYGAVLFFLCFLAASGGYDGEFKKEGGTVTVYGFELNPDQRFMVWRAIDALYHAAFKTILKERRFFSAFVDIDEIARNIEHLHRKGNINERVELRTGDVKPTYAATLDDGSEASDEDKIGVKEKYLKDRLGKKFLLAAILAHEVKHAKLEDIGGLEHELSALAKEIQVEFALFDVIRQEVPLADQQQVMNAVNVLLMEAQDNYNDIREKLRRKRSSKESHVVAKPKEPEGLAIRLDLDDIRVSIVSSKPFIITRHQITFEESKINFQRIEFPQSAAILKIKGELLFVVSGTTLNHSTGIIEVFRFLTRTSEEGTQIISGIDARGAVIFQMENIWPASVTVDERNDNIYILDSLERRILLLRNGLI